MDRILEVENLKKYYQRIKGFSRKVIGTVKAVDSLSFSINKKETLALVGESGCGKTTIGRCIVRAVEPTDGKMSFFDSAGEKKDLLSLDFEQLKLIRRDIRMIFQDPFASLNPRMTLMNIIGEPLKIHRITKSSAELKDRVAELLKMVHLDPDYMNRYPHAFSGGQRQRIAIARALALEPSLVIADEPVSALDVSVQAQILNLMKELQEKTNLAYLFIAHNLAVVRYQSDRIAVMYVGKIVELSDKNQIFNRPQHPYTETLLLASPNPNPHERHDKLHQVKGDIPDPANRPTGCAFHPRCNYAQEKCKHETPHLIDVSDEKTEPHLVACHYWDELNLLTKLPTHHPEA